MSFAQLFGVFFGDTTELDVVVDVGHQLTHLRLAQIAQLCRLCLLALLGFLLAGLPDRILQQPRQHLLVMFVIVTYTGCGRHLGCEGLDLGKFRLRIAMRRVLLSTDGVDDRS